MPIKQHAVHIESRGILCRSDTDPAQGLQEFHAIHTNRRTWRVELDTGILFQGAGRKFEVSFATVNTRLTRGIDLKTDFRVMGFS